MRNLRSNDPRAALEALFAPKKPAEPEPRGARASVKIVTRSTSIDGDPRRAERDRLLEKMLAAEGRPAVTKAASELERAGFEFPPDQEVQLKLLEHSDEACVKNALHVLSSLLETQAPRRKTVLESRLRRLEEGAEDLATRELATALRRKLAGSGSRTALRGRD